VEQEQNGGGSGGCETDVYCLDATDFVLNALTHTAFLLRIWNSDWKSEVNYLFFFDDVYFVIF